MDFLSAIRQSISDKTINNLSTFLGEEFEAVEAGLHLSLNSFMAGLLKFAYSDVETKKIINVLNDGGHNGDVLNNLESFTANFEKTQLLITIGNNIVSHFLNTKTTNIVEKITDLSGIKKTSASSLLSISAPMVLGFIGKVVKEKKLDSSGLRNYFKDLSSSVINGLPPVIANIFQFQKNVYTIKNSDSLKKTKPKTSSSTNFWSVLPWLVLICAGLFSIFYYNYLKPSRSLLLNSEPTELKEKDISTVPEDFLPDGTLPTRDTVKDIVRPNLDTQKPNVGQVRVDESAPEKEPAKKSEPLVEKKKVVETKINEPKPQIAKSVKGSDLPSKTETAAQVPSGWRSAASGTYRANSAEIKNESFVNSLVQQVKGTSKVVKIAALSGSNGSLNEDRSYALREKLLEKGLTESQVIVTSSVVGKEASGVVVKVTN
jgi:OmpA-OmpF porin, OOP family